MKPGGVMWGLYKIFLFENIIGNQRKKNGDFGVSHTHVHTKMFVGVEKWGHETRRCNVGSI